MNVKICGITRQADAMEACRLGAWAVGFIFTPASPRYIAPRDARAIIDALPASVRKVGVVTNESLADITAISEAANIDMVQLHGAEDPLLCRAIALPWIKRMGSPSDLREYSGAFAYLVDSVSDSGLGGTGALADWTTARAIASHAPLLLAGGLTPDNVARAIEEVRPWGVDVASGVESRPGVKDFAKLEAFFAATKTYKA